jgi:hypothetical protein
MLQAILITVLICGAILLATVAMMNAETPKAGADH